MFLSLATADHISKSTSQCPSLLALIVPHFPRPFCRTAELQHIVVTVVSFLLDLQGFRYCCSLAPYRGMPSISRPCCSNLLENLFLRSMERFGYPSRKLGGCVVLGPLLNNLGQSVRLRHCGDVLYCAMQLDTRCHWLLYDALPCYVALWEVSSCGSAPVRCGRCGWLRDRDRLCFIVD